LREALGTAQVLRAGERRASGIARGSPWHAA